MKQLTIGILAHVDAGKTTLSESFLYLSNTIRTKGRVDHKNAFLDYDKQERERGITIYSKQARFKWKDTAFTLIDTPGHVDFSSEMERTLQILDAAVLVVNGCDGVQSHTETIWKLLMYYQIPVFVFVNKMDISYLSKEKLMNELKQLDGRICDISKENELLEQAAMTSDELLDKFINHELDNDDIAKAIASFSLFPCVFGSALKEENVDMLLDMLDKWTKEKQYPALFGAKVFKITHDENHKKWIHLKITGGVLQVKDKVNDDKIDQIRLYSGERYENVQMASAGDICAVSGLESIQLYHALGYEKAVVPQLDSYIRYRMILPEGCDILEMQRNLKLLSEEDPQLHITYEEELKEIYLQLMGEVQIEIVKNVIFERFKMKVSFDQGSIILKETICEAVEGIGHFEPLRHYAEVHVLLEPLERGSGVVVENKCSEAQLAGHWQRLIMTHLQEKIHKGVLTGSPMGDMRITLLAGKAHPKHTEGGDFRQAAYRAVRQGLRSTSCIVLEPYYSFTLKVPASCLSRAIYDIEKRNGSFEIKESSDNICVITGKASVRSMRDYQLEVINYTKGNGRLTCTLSGYEECQNQQEMIEKIGYDCNHDLENPCGSIFCERGAGFYVPYDQVEHYMHLKKCIKSEAKGYSIRQPKKIDDSEVLAVFERAYGKVQTRLHHSRKDEEDEKKEIKLQMKKPCLLVDGYNIIHSWKQLSVLARDHLEAARDRLIDIMSSYQGYKNCLLILVFDAYKVADNTGKAYDNGNIKVIYTKTAQSADAYIEQAAHKLSQDYQITVATSDGLEQLIILGQGARRISAREFEKEVFTLNKRMLKEYENSQSKRGHRKLEKLRELNESE